MKLPALTASLILLLAGACSTGSEPSPSPSVLPSAAPTPTSAVPDPTPAPTRRSEWPFVQASCEAAPGEPLVVVALGTSETAGWGVQQGESYSPQAAYPALYAEILCAELDRPVELRSYFPSQYGNTLAPLAWWIDKVENERPLQADLAAANVVALWAMSSHDVVAAQVLPGACRGDWSEAYRVCLLEKAGRIPTETDELFAKIAGLVPDDAVVLAGDAFAPPVIVNMLGDKPYRDEVKAILDPYFTVEPLAERYGFVFVDTELVFNGPSRWEMPADGLFQGDALHMTLAGQTLAAEAYAAADGLGD